MQDFKQLKVWENSHVLTLAVYTATRSFPKQELYGVTSQLRRAAASVPANIAEGCGRNSGPELLRFLEIAMGSASECEYDLLLSRDLELLTLEIHDQLNTQVSEVKRMLAVFIVKLKTEN